VRIWNVHPICFGGQVQVRREGMREGGRVSENKSGKGSRRGLKTAVDLMYPSIYIH